VDRRVQLPATARSLMAGVMIAADIAVCLLWTQMMSTVPEKRGLLLASIVTLVVGVVCLIGVIALGVTWRRPVSTRRPNRNTAVSVLSLVSILKLVGGFLAMAVLGGFSDGNGLQIMVSTMVESLIVVGLSIGAGRHVARTAAGARG
jgi:CHASE2 domain-containing sensor protein